MNKNRKEINTLLQVLRF